MLSCPCSTNDQCDIFDLGRPYRLYLVKNSAKEAMGDWNVFTVNNTKYKDIIGSLSVMLCRVKKGLYSLVYDLTGQVPWQDIHQSRN